MKCPPCPIEGKASGFLSKSDAIIAGRKAVRESRERDFFSLRTNGEWHYVLFWKSTKAGAERTEWLR